MKIIKRTYITLLLAMVAVWASAQGPNSTGTYYQAANGKKAAALKSALCGIIYNRTEKTYDYLWTAFRTTDVRSDGKVWDMYSNITNFTFGTDQAGNYSQEGDVYNREHSFPKSWFGGEKKPMYTDLHHMYPTDGYVNNQRSNYPFGETNGNKYKSANNFSKLGNCTYPGYTGIVFEPADEYKGDFARTYFYMITCYEEKLHDWYTNYSESRPTIDGSTYPGFQTWQLNMLMEWATNDPVSEKETARNNAVYGIQNNRNPFIDYPGLEQYIWGTKTNDAFSYDSYVQPDGSSSGGGGGGDDPGDDPDPSLAGTYKLTITLSDFVTGGYAANNSEKTSQAVCTTDATKTYEVKWTSYQVANQDGNIQWQKNVGYIYNSTDLGTIKSVTVTSSEGTFTTYYGTSEQPSSSTTVGGGYFKTVVGNATGKTSKIEVVFSLGGDEPVDPTFNNLSDISVDYGSTLTLTSGTTGTPNIVTDGTVTLESSNTAVVTVNGLTITPVAVGTALITVNTGATSAYNAGSDMFPVTVNAPEGKTEAAPGGTIVFVETFANSTGTSGWGGSAGNGDLVFDNKTGWSKMYGYGNGGSARFGNSSSAGYVTTPSIAATVGTVYTLTFKAGPWDRESTTMNVTTTGATISGISTQPMTTRQWNDFTATITATSLSFRITFAASNNRFFLDEIVVTNPGISVTATLNDYGYASFCSEYPLDFSSVSDFSAWQITNIDSDNNITFAKVTGSVKGGTGLLLKGEGNATVTIPSVNSTNVLSDNLLEGVMAPTYVDLDTYYGLKGNTLVPVAASTVPAGKAILPASIVAESEGEVKPFVFVFEDDEDGINDLNANVNLNEGAIYNLAGQRLSKMQKGINIVNGKKVLKK